MKSLTGKRRYRVENNKLILQVEWSTYDLFSRARHWDWRDATPEDLTVHDAGD